MADNCKGCGAELSAGQRFCRMCGRPTGELADEQAPTRNMPPAQPIQNVPQAQRSADSIPSVPPPTAQPGPYPGWQGPGQGSAATAPAQRPDTAPVYPVQQQPGYYQRDPGYPAYYPPPQKSGSRLGWVFAFVGMGLFAAIIFAVLLFTVRLQKHRPPLVVTPPPPPSAGNPGDTAMDESSAVETMTQTVITKTIPLTPGASLSIKNANGRIHVEAWDGPGAQVTVTKLGGSGATRKMVPIYQQFSGNRLSLHASERNNIEVSYDLKVPKQMGSVDVDSTNGSVKLDGLGGDLNVKATNGSVTLSNISGSASVTNMTGSITATFDEASADKPMSFHNVNGSVRLQFKSGVNAQLRAKTVTGSINVDPEWGVEVRKGLVGATADGPLGTGGQPLKVDTVNGTISIMKLSGAAGH